MLIVSDYLHEHIFSKKSSLPVRKQTYVYIVSVSTRIIPVVATVTCFVPQKDYT